MAKSNLGSMSVEALLKLREDVGKVLSQKAVQLEEQLSKLGREVGSGTASRGSAMKAGRCRQNIATRRAIPGWGEERSRYGCERSSRLVRSSKTLPFTRQRLLANPHRGKQRRADARSDDGCRSLPRVAVRPSLTIEEFALPTWSRPYMAFAPSLLPTKRN
jgi:hypothetical protein